MRQLLQNATILLQNATVITKCDDFVTKCDSYHKMRRLLQIATVQRRASKDMQSRVNSASCRLTAPSEFLFNKLMLKFCQLLNGL